jgi:hypothetical protein
MGRYYTAYVTDTGLARRLGQEVALTKKKDIKSKRRMFGKLVFYPDKFALHQEGEVGEGVLTSIEYGDLIGLRIGARTGPIWPDYVYQKG